MALNSGIPRKTIHQIINLTNSDGLSAVSAAALQKNGQFENVIELVKNGATVTEQDIQYVKSRQESSDPVIELLKTIKRFQDGDADPETIDYLYKNGVISIHTVKQHNTYREFKLKHLNLIQRLDEYLDPAESFLAARKRYDNAKKAAAKNISELNEFIQKNTAEDRRIRAN